LLVSAGESSMPYELRKVHGGYKVGHKGMSKTYSKKPQSKAKAAAQMRAIYANTPKSHMKEEVLHEEKTQEPYERRSAS
jgi:hypothetical protein